MGITAGLVPEFDQEMSTTRKTLERVPEDKFDWKPHPKSTAMGGLATHVSNIPSWTSLTLQGDSLDLAPGGNPMPPMQMAASREDLLATFDKNVAAAREALTAASDEQLLKPWTLLRNGETLMTIPKVAVLRGFVLSHIIHHRAQLGVYLRLNDIPVPSVYGPSADESPF